VVRNLRSHRAEPMDETTVDKTVASNRSGDAAVRTREPVRSREPVTEPVVEASPRWTRTSAFATLGLIIGVVAVLATLTGLLAPVGVALGVVGGAIAAGGLVGASRRGVTGHGVALLGLVCSLIAIVIGVLAISGNLSWLSTRTDEVARLRDWLNVHISWFRHW
jgi:hypothetical protein